MKTKKKNKKKLIVFLILAVAAIAVAAFAVINMKNAASNVGMVVSTEAVTRQDVERSVTVKGTVKGTDSAQVYSKSVERIAEILVKEGDFVKTGQVLCELEKPDNSIQLRKTELALEQAQKDYDKKEVLYKSGDISKDTLEQSEYNLISAKLAKEELEKAMAETTVKSPIEGTVTRVNASVGSLAGSNTTEPLFVIENIEKLEMKIRVSEYDITDIKAGQDVEITNDFLGAKVLKGKVTSIAPTGEAKGAGSSEMVIPVVISIDKGDSGLIAGLTAKARIITGTAENAIALPIDSIMDDEEGNTYVFVAKDGVAYKRIVNIILEADFYVAIEDGAVEEGEEIILSPSRTLEDGAAVTVLNF